MADLIDRDALIAEYDRVHVGAPGGARKLMVDAPRVDAAPISHGYWATKERLAPVLSPDNGGYTVAAYLYKKHKYQCCSVCGVEPIENNYGYTNWNYCPYCGAKMDEEVEI